MAEPPVDPPESSGDEPAAPRPGGPEISRRTFLGGAAGAASMVYLRPFRLLARRPAAASTGPGTNPIGIVNGGPDIVLSVERQEDLVLLDFSFYGFSLQDGSPPTIVPNDPSNNTIVVQFPPQAIAEAEYCWTQPTPGNYILPVDPPPILSDLSGTSRLCFTTSQSIPLTTLTPSDVLDWSQWSLLVPPVAEVGIVLGTSGPPSSPPSYFQTAIEFPYALFLSPVVHVGPALGNSFSTAFTSRPAPLVSPSGVVDLWSTELTGAWTGGFVSGTETAQIVIGHPQTPFVPMVSAVWASDFDTQLLSDATPEDYIDYGEPIS
jgi:hypothetical protein